VHEGQAVALELLHDEALAAEEAHGQLLLEVQADGHAARRAQERVLLAHQHAAELAQVHGDDLARVGGGERHAGLAGALVGVDRGEQRLAGDQALARAEQLAEQAAALLAAVTEHGVHADRRIHEEQAAGLTHGRLAGVELDLHELHLRALDLVVHDIHRHCCVPCSKPGGTWPRRREWY
jgi:hypothetical protein